MQMQYSWWCGLAHGYYVIQFFSYHTDIICYHLSSIQGCQEKRLNKLDLSSRLASYRSEMQAVESPSSANYVFLRVLTVECLSSTV